MSSIKCILSYVMFLSWFTVVAQLGLQVDSGQAVLFGSDTIGSGKKLMWLPSKAALRAGYLNKFNSQNWDHDSIGKYSVAFGSNSQALGNKLFGDGNSLLCQWFWVDRDRVAKLSYESSINSPWW